MSGSILALPKNEGCIVLDTNASDFGLGAVLSQRQTEAPSEAPASKPDRKPRVSQSEKIYRLRFKDVIESQKQVRLDTKGIAGRGFRP